MTIKLSDFYPFCETDDVVEAPDEVYEALLGWKREEAAYMRRLYRYKAYYSLNRGDGIEGESQCFGPPPYEIIAGRSLKRELYDAMASLPDKQAKRLYAYFFMDMSEYEIAASENVSQQTVNRTICRALQAVKKRLNNSLYENGL